jgi:uncharacterized damage-inducible protein DinB
MRRHGIQSVRGNQTLNPLEEFMAISASLLPEFDMEMAGARKILERVPDDKFDYKPHPKSMSLRQLAVHVGFFPQWAIEVLEKSELDLAPVGGEGYKTPPINSRKELLEVFDKDLAQARKDLEKASDADLMQTWTLLAGGKTLFAMPRIAVLRSSVMNHMIHHRAQLGVYLRLNDIPLPGFYGPTADEK